MCTARQFPSARGSSLFVREAFPSHAETFFVLPREVFAPQKIFCLSAKLSLPRRNFFFCLSPYFTVSRFDRCVPSRREGSLAFPRKIFFAVTFPMLSPSISFMTCPRGSFVLYEKLFLPATARNNSGFPFPYYYIEKLCLLKVAATETFFQLIPYRFKCPPDFLYRPIQSSCRLLVPFRFYFQTARAFALHVAALSNAFPFELFHDLPARFFRLV